MVFLGPSVSSGFISATMLFLIMPSFIGIFQVFSSFFLTLDVNNPGGREGKWLVRGRGAWESSPLS
jgi:hypothetical protein